MIPLNNISQNLIKNQPQNSENYNANSFKSFISHQIPNASITQKMQLPMDSQNIRYSLTIPRKKNIPSTKELKNNYIPPLGSRLPLEKDHHPFKYFNVSNDNNDNSTINKKNVKIKDVSEFNLQNPEKVEFIPGNHYEISEYADIFRDVLQQPGTNEDLIVKLIETTYNKDRQLIRNAYIQKYNEDLISRFKKQLSGDFREAVIGSFLDPTEYDCYCLHNSMKLSGTRESVFTEIIGSRKNSELQAIRKFYTSKYGERLKNDIAGETYGDYQRFLVALLRCQRSTSSQPNTSSCANDASDLYQLGEKKRENDEETYIRIFTTSSPMEISIINHFYKQQTGKGLLGAIESEFDFSAETKHLLDTMIRAQVDLYGLYAKRIHEALENISSNNSILIRNICSRYCIDLPLIKEAYKRDYINDMMDDIKSKTSGNYGRIIYSLAGKEK